MTELKPLVIQEAFLNSRSTLLSKAPPVPCRVSDKKYLLLHDRPIKVTFAHKFTERSFIKVYNIHGVKTQEPAMKKKKKKKRENPALDAAIEIFSIPTTTHRVASRALASNCYPRLTVTTIILRNPELVLALKSSRV